MSWHAAHVQVGSDQPTWSAAKQNHFLLRVFPRVWFNAWVLFWGGLRWTSWATTPYWFVMLNFCVIQSVLSVHSIFTKSKATVSDWYLIEYSHLQSSSQGLVPAHPIHMLTWHFWICEWDWWRVTTVWIKVNNANQQNQVHPLSCSLEAHLSTITRQTYICVLNNKTKSWFSPSWSSFTAVDATFPLDLLILTPVTEMFQRAVAHLQVCALLTPQMPLMPPPLSLSCM